MTDEHREGTGEMGGVQARVVEMSALLKQRAPLVRPCVVPRELQEAFAGMQRFLASNTGKLPAAVDAASSTVAAISAEGTEGGQEEEEAGGLNGAGASGPVGEDGKRTTRERPEGRCHVLLTTETDFTTRTFRITAAKFGAKTDAILSNLELLMELLLNANKEELEPFAATFVSSNNLECPDWKAAVVLQEVVSLAYALKVAASNIGGWKGFAGSYQLPLADGADMNAVAEELFKPPPLLISPPRPKSGKGKKKGNSRSKSAPAKTKKAAAVGQAAAAVGGAGGDSKARGKEGNASAKGLKRKK